MKTCRSTFTSTRTRSIFAGRRCKSMLVFSHFFVCESTSCPALVSASVNQYCTIYSELCAVGSTVLFSSKVYTSNLVEVSAQRKNPERMFFKFLHRTRTNKNFWLDKRGPTTTNKCSTLIVKNSDNGLPTSHGLYWDTTHKAVANKHIFFFKLVC